MTDHLDMESLSATLDGEPEDSHLGSCEVCLGRLAELRMARDAMAGPVTPLPDEARDQAIARALAAAPAAGPEQEPVGPPVEDSPPLAPVSPLARPDPERAGQRSRRGWIGGSVAAAVMVVALGAVALVGGLGGSKSEDTATFGATAENATGSTAGANAGSGQAVDAGDLGDVATLDALVARTKSSRAAAGAPTGLAGEAAPAADRAATTATPGAPTPRVVGTRVCEVEARTARPQLGPVVFAANLRFQGTPAVALGFASTPGAPPETLLVLAPGQDCRILAATTPS